MRVDRLLAIVNILAEKGKVTAPELANYLEVSRRTINRDIDSLSMAGIPIVTEQGKNGGISILEGYTLDKRILNEVERSDIVAGLKGIESVSASPASGKLLQRGISNSDSVLSIDLASYYKDSLSKKIDSLKLAILERKIIEFDYYSPSGKSSRQVKPYRILYRWSNWYLVGWCLMRQDYRFFKLNRLWQLQVTAESFLPEKIEDEVLAMGTHLCDDKPFEVLFHKRIEYLVIETYGPKSYVEIDEGLLFSGHYTDEAFIVRWLLSFGKDAEVMSPPELIEAIKRQTKKIES